MKKAIKITVITIVLIPIFVWVWIYFDELHNLKQGELDRMRYINGILLVARNNILYAYKACGSLPVNKEEIEEIIKKTNSNNCKEYLKEDVFPPRDYWKTPVRIEKTKENFTTRSAGKDKIFGTKDDMVKVDKYDGSTFPIW